MNHDKYGHDFQDGKRNGWENDIGSPDGVLKSEEGPGGKNTFWSGKLEYRPPNIFLPSLAKMFTFPGPRQDDPKPEKGFLFTSFRYRVHPPEAGEATTIRVIVTANVSLGYNAFYIDPNTPTGVWLQTDPIGVRYSGTKAHIVIGTNAAEPGVSRKFDLDNIEVVRVPDK
ncbi:MULTISPECIES: hypothetical protein [Pseudomonas]|uniref:Uncharacterized protein n=1 Tax=Pseudomonas bijieensis TaxID=2681983 RepID=A0A6N1CIE8_9PSED|nr:MULTISPECIES: hypothetical protein [Pseudomonas]AXP05795.1 hypothetical protein DZG01_23665 [Pseudomonas fluorescens]PWJ33113.1 hypothetical protein ATJ40_111209 [Pseudomonas sp. 43mfcvi1.1]QIB06242.1 hypothetical protein GZ982_16405 [Pseudomonas fluorescens]QKS84150.1 hypothetical protein GN234_20250 [Pseudomonas bijieensis]SSB98348.1 hypothetical protein SAMN04488697_111209 [Pseudomonas sp. 43mfcvi1.1]